MTPKASSANRLFATLLAALFLLPALPGSAFAQGRKKRDVEIKTQDSSGALEKEAEDKRRKQKGADGPSQKLGEQVARRDKRAAVADAAWQDAFGKLKQIIKATPDSDPLKAELWYRLSEMFWEKSAGLSITAFDKENQCLGNAANKSMETACAAERQKMLDLSAQYREKAIEVYVHIVKNYPDYQELDGVLFALAFNYQRKQAPEKAKKIYIELIKRYPRSVHVPDTLLNVGEIFFEAGDVQQALKAYQKVVTNYKDSSVYGYALYKLGWCYFNLGNHTAALASFLKVIDHANQIKTSGDRKNRLTIKKEATRDLVRTYVNIPNANPVKAIGLYKKKAPDDWLKLSENTADLYGITGQFEKSNRLYRELIRLNPSTYKVVTYQKQIAFNTKNIGRQVETVKELKRLVSLWDKVKGAKDAEADQVRKDCTGIEELLRGQAVIHHRQAKKTKSDKDYAVAYELYTDYTRVFADPNVCGGKPLTEEIYTMNFYFAELLWDTRKWEESAKRYDEVLTLNPKGEFTADAAHGSVLACNKLINTSDSAPQSVCKADSLESCDVPPPVTIPEQQQKCIAARDRYVSYVKESEYLVDIKYDNAMTYYTYNHFDKALPIFKDISEKHARHRLSVYAANLTLDIYNLLKQPDKLETQADTYLKAYPEERDPEFHALLITIKQQATFKRCEKHEATKDFRKAGNCFVRYAQKFPDSEYLDKAYYNAALNYEREKMIEPAIRARLDLVNKASGSELVPQALYAIGGNLHALAIYSQASRFYEIYASRHPKIDLDKDGKPESRDALQNAAVFRQGLGEYDKAIENYEAFMKLIGKDKAKRADVFFSLGLIYKKQENWNKVIDHFSTYLRSYAKDGKKDRVLESYTHMGNAYEKMPGWKNVAKAEKAYATTYKEFNKLSDAEKKGLTTGLAAVAEARFHMGEAIFEEFKKDKLKVTSIRNVKRFVKKMSEEIKKKTEFITKAQPIYEEVIKYQSANWAIAALTRVGQMYQDLANEIYNLPAPASFNEEQVEIFKGDMAQRASIVEQKAVSAYILAIKKAQELQWFNDYSDLAEKQLAKLNPREYRYPSEIRTKPNHFDQGFIGQGFIAELPKEKDEL